MIVHNGKEVGPDDVIVLPPETQRRFEAALDRIAEPLTERLRPPIPDFHALLADIHVDSHAAVSARNSEALVRQISEERELLAALLAQNEAAAQRETAAAAADERRHRLDVVIAVLLVILGALLGAVLSAVIGG